MYFVTMVGNVPWLGADNTPWSHHGRAMADHVLTSSGLKNHGTMVNVLPGSEQARCPCEMNSV